MRGSPLPLVLVLVLAACQDQALTKFNAPPEAEVLSPADGAAIVEGDVASLRGTVSDTNDSTSDLIVTWFAGDSELCVPAAPEGDGSTSCSWTADTSGAALRLEVVDPEGEADVASITLAVTPNTAPTAEVVAPVESGRYHADDLVELDGLATDPEDGPDALTVTWVSSVDGALDIATTVEPDGHSRGATTLSEGEHLLSFSVVDGFGKAAVDTTLVEILPPNVAPTCAISAPSPGALVHDVDGAEFTATVADPDQPAEALLVDWSSDVDGWLGTSLPETTGAVAWTAAALTLGTHTISMTVTDEDAATCVHDVVITVVAAPSVAIVSPADGSTVREGEAVTLTADVYDVEDDPADIALVWESDLDGRLSVAPADSSGRAIVAIEGLSAGAHTLTLTATDGQGLSTSAAVLVVVNQAPTAPIVSLSPDDPRTTDDLGVRIDTASTDPDGDPISYTYTWLRDGVVSSASTSATLPASATARDEVWAVRVTPDDGYGAGPAGESSITIGNTPPELSAASLSPSTAYTEDTLAVSGTTVDADGDVVTVSWSWTADGVVVGTGEQLEGNTFSRDQRVIATGTPDDGTDDGAPLATTALTIANSPPTAPTASLDPSFPVEGMDDLVCVVDADATDADGDPVSYTIAWTVDGTAFPAAETTLLADDTILNEDLVEAQVWTCNVTPSDGTDFGPAAAARGVVEGCPYGQSATCPGPSCADLLASGASLGDGLYWLDLGTGAVESWCDMSTDGGGWTLAAVVAEDGIDTWTYARRHAWDTDSAPFGAIDARDRDYLGPALHQLAFTDVLFRHHPSDAWAVYGSVGDGTGSFADVVAGVGEEYCYHSKSGYPMTAGSLVQSGGLCDTTLYLNPADQDGTGGCGCASGCAHAFGPAWSVNQGEGCPLDDPGSAGLGPDSGAAGERGSLGFADTLGLNTGAKGTGENAMWVLVR